MASSMKSSAPWHYSIWIKWLSSRSPHFIWNSDGLNAHCSQTSKQKSSRKPFAVYLPVYLVGLFLDAQRPKSTCQTLVGYSARLHFRPNQILDLVFPFIQGGFVTQTFGEFLHAYSASYSRWISNFRWESDEFSHNFSHIRPECNFAPNGILATSHQQFFTP